MKKSKILPLSDRHLEILKFLWRWKAATTYTLAFVFFRELKCMEDACYLCLRKLSARGYTQLKYTKDGRVVAWTLTKKGFESIKPSLPELRKNGFDSEALIHDLRVSSFQFGELFLKPYLGDKINICTEQELRLIHSSLLPIWLPEDDEHRADGYFGIHKDNKIRPIAIEVETSLKSIPAYSEIQNYYCLNEMVDGIVWILDNPNWIRTIHKGLSEITADPAPKHYFFSWKDFLKNGWDISTIKYNRSVHKLTEILNIQSTYREDSTIIPSEYQSIFDGMCKSSIKRLKTNTYKEVKI